MQTQGDMLKQMGLDLVTEHNPDFVEIVRERAIRLAKMNGRVSSDALREWAELHDITPIHPNAWGAVFRGPGWERIGFRKSRIPSNHSRMISIWRYKE